jgi:hypothetical protein
MHRPNFHWPTHRRLFRRPAKRKRTVLFWLTLSLAVGAAGVVAALSRVPPV